MSTGLEGIVIEGNGGSSNFPEHQLDNWSLSILHHKPQRGQATDTLIS